MVDTYVFVTTHLCLPRASRELALEFSMGFLTLLVSARDEFDGRIMSVIKSKSHLCVATIISDILATLFTSCLSHHRLRKVTAHARSHLGKPQNPI